MLPERLSANICSLQPCEDRLALSILARITPDGELIDAQIAETVIRSHASLSYEEVQRVIDTTAGRENPAEPYADVLRHMEALRSRLTERRMARGAIDFEIPEPLIILNDAGHPIDILPRDRLNSHRLIEEFMLLANEIVARRMADSGIPILYRVHEPPDSEKLAAFYAMAKALGYRLSKSSRANGIQKFLATFKDAPIGHILSSRLLRSLKKAIYTPDNCGHFGLACDTYTHFTSPIRRYPDLILHRILRDAINGITDPDQLARRASRLPDIGDLATQREIAAQQAEWDVISAHANSLSERQNRRVFRTQPLSICVPSVSLFNSMTYSSRAWFTSNISTAIIIFTANGKACSLVNAPARLSSSAIRFRYNSPNSTSNACG